MGRKREECCSCGRIAAQLQMAADVCLHSSGWRWSTQPRNRTEHIRSCWGFILLGLNTQGLGQWDHSRAFSALMCFFFFFTSEVTIIQINPSKKKSFPQRAAKTHLLLICILTLNTDTIFAISTSNLFAVWWAPFQLLFPVSKKIITEKATLHKCPLLWLGCCWCWGHTSLSHPMKGHCPQAWG